MSRWSLICRKLRQPTGFKKPGATGYQMISRRRTLSTLATLGAVLLGQSMAPIPAEANQCWTTTEPMKDQVFIDANTGEVQGETYFSRGSRVEVVFINKNPFKYSYAFSIDTEPVDSSAVLATFFGLVPVLAPVSGLWNNSKDAAETAKIDAGAAPVAPPVPGAQPVCGGAEKQILDRFGRDVKLMITEGAGLRPRARGVATNFAVAQLNYSEFLAAVQPDAIVCSVITDRADNTRKALVDFTVGDLPEKVAKYKKDIEGLQEVIGYFRPSPACSARHTELVLIAQGLRMQAEELSAQVEEAAKGKKSFGGLVQTIDAIAATTASYYETRRVSGGWKSFKATAKIVRTPRTPENATAEPAKAVELQVGQPFFSLSAGLGVSSIGETVTSKESSLIPDGSGGEELGERFAVTEESDPAPLGAVLLNANLWRPWKKRDRTVAVSVGVTIGSSDQASNFGYLIGPSLALLNNSLYFTLGYHLRDIKTLGGGFEAGDPVPAGLQGIPLRGETKEGVMFVVSYKIR